MDRQAAALHLALGADRRRPPAGRAAGRWPLAPRPTSSSSGAASQRGMRDWPVARIMRRRRIGRRRPGRARPPRAAGRHDRAHRPPGQRQHALHHFASSARGRRTGIARLRALARARAPLRRHPRLPSWPSARRGRRPAGARTASAVPVAQVGPAGGEAPLAVAPRDLVEQPRSGSRSRWRRRGSPSGTWTWNASTTRLNTDHQQEAEAQDDDRRVAVTKAVSGRLATIISADRDHDRDDHHGELVDHAHRGDHRVEREHRVQDHDLGDHLPERRRRRRGPRARRAPPPAARAAPPWP